MTGINVQAKDLKGFNPIEKEHVDNSSAVRNTLLQRGIYPENQPKADDVKKIQRKLETEDEKANRNFRGSRKKK
jgi:DNA-damage-inducible protein D